MIRVCAYVYVHKTNHEGREIGGIVIKGKTRLHMRFQKGKALKKAFPRHGQRTHSSV